MKISTKLDNYLKKIYFNPAHPAGFKGSTKLYQAVKDEGKYKVTWHMIREWLKNQETYTLHKPVIRKYKRTPVIVTGLYDQYEADLADMQKLKDKNDGVTFLLVVIDVFSRYVWVYPLKSKGEKDVVLGFKTIFKEGQKPKRLRTDRGKEFTSNKMEDFFNDENIEHYTANNDEMKANYAEIVIRTIKFLLWGYMRKQKNYRYVDVLQDIITGYNKTKHRTTGIAPVDVTKGDVENYLWWHQYKPKISYEKSQKLHARKFLFKKGDHVRISHMAQKFERGHDEKWTREIFVIRKPFHRRGIKKYSLKDLLGEDIKGSFYESELQGITYNPNETYEIEKVIRKRGRGNNAEVLIKWLGWPEKFNSWIKESTIKE